MRFLEWSDSERKGRMGAPKGQGLWGEVNDNGYRVSL